MTVTDLVLVHVASPQDIDTALSSVVRLRISELLNATGN